MAENHPKTINELLASDDKTLHNIVENIALLQSLNKALQQLLPKHLLEHCRIINNRNNTLVLGTSNSLAATELKFHTNELLHQLRRSIVPSLAQIEVKILPELN